MEFRLPQSVSQSVAWKLILPIPVFALVAVLAIWRFVPPIIENNVRADAEYSLKLTAEQFKTVRRYYTNNVVEKVLANSSLRPTSDHQGNPGAIPLPATFMHDMSVLLSEANTRIDLYSAFPFPQRQSRILDRYQQQAWDHLTANPDQAFVRQKTLNGKEVLRVAIADKMVADTCVNCHNTHPESPKIDWKLGDVRGVLEVSTIIDGQLARGAKLSNRIIVATIIGAALLILVSLLAASSLTRPLGRMTAAMKELAGGNNDVDIPDLARIDEIGKMADAVQIFKENAIKKHESDLELVRHRDQLQDTQKQLEHIAFFDALTGLANRAHCQRDMLEKFSLHDPNARFAIIQFDIDNFKRVNDTLGHAAGDCILDNLGERLKRFAGKFSSFKAYRWGGDEFIALIDRDDDTDLAAICENLTDLISEPVQYEKVTLRPTVSLGVARHPEDSTDIKSLMIFADLALYKTKQLGRDGYQFFTSDMKEKIDTETRIEQELRIAIEEDQLELHFQPQLDVDDETITGVEALLRWNHPQKGLIRPGDFLYVAESTGLAQAIGCRVFDRAMAAVRNWSDQGVEFGRLTINLSPQHLKKNAILDDFFYSMRKHNVPPELLAVEFLESFIFDDPHTDIVDILQEFISRGINVELDDFGTGYASLSHLSTLPISGLKIDQSFIHLMTDDLRQLGIVSSLISMSKLMDLRVVCEGIETQQQANAIMHIGNCSAQGHLIAKPMSFANLTDWINEGRNIGALRLRSATTETTRESAIL